jgi:hypothetical protein
MHAFSSSRCSRSIVRCIPAVIALATVAGCSRKNSPDFGGTFHGQSTMGMTVRMPTGSTENVGDNDTKEDDLRIADDDGPEIRVTLVDDPDTHDHCELRAQRHGTSAVIMPNQNCSLGHGADAIRATVSRGTVALVGDNVTVDVAFATAMNVEGSAMRGTMNTHFTGHR